MTGGRGILVAWCAMLVVVAVGLHALGGGPLAAPPLHAMRSAAWLAARDPLIAAFAVFRVLVLGLCWYLIAATVAGLVSRWLRADRAAVVLDRVTVPLVRRIVQQAAGISMATMLVTAPTAAVAASPGVGVVSIRVAESPAIPGPLLPRVRGPAPESPGSEEPLMLPWQVASEAGDVAVVEEDPARTSTAPADAGDTVYLVRSGDSLWRIAFRHLEARFGHAPSDREVVPFWERLIEVNRDRLVDPHDPDLIVPGQELLVPSVVAP